MIYIGAEYPLAAQVAKHSAVLGAVTLASLAIAWFFSRWLQSAITRPILVMTAAVNEVIRRRDFSTRVQKSTDDEVGTLADAFNTMLEEVGERARAQEASNQRLQHEVAERESAEQAVRQLNSTLEARIAERTRELEKAHEQLRQSQKLEAIGQLTGGVAHDFNNVLQVISGNLQMLQMTASQDPLIRKRVDTAIFAADRGAKLSSQLLAFARRQPLQPVPTNVGKVLRGMDDLLRRALGESIDIETVVAGGLWTTLVDPHQLENVILNLAINARDAMKGNGRLTLELGNAMSRTSPSCAPAITWCWRSRTPAAACRPRSSRAPSNPSSRPSRRGRERAWACRWPMASSSRATATSRFTANRATAPRSRSTCRARARPKWSWPTAVRRRWWAAARPSWWSKTISRCRPRWWTS
jgi:signal transduction histidine kinase